MMQGYKEGEGNLLGQAFLSLNPILYFFSVKDDIAIIGKSARAGKVAVSFRITELFDEKGGKVKPESTQDPRLADFKGCTAMFELALGKLRLSGSNRFTYSYKWIDGRTVTGHSAVAKLQVDDTVLNYLKLGMNISVFGDADAEWRSSSERSRGSSGGDHTVLDVATNESVDGSGLGAGGALERRESSRVAELRSKMKAARKSLVAVQNNDDSRSCVLQ